MGLSAGTAGLGGAVTGTAGAPGLSAEESAEYRAATASERTGL